VLMVRFYAESGMVINRNQAGFGISRGWQRRSVQRSGTIGWFPQAFGTDSTEVGPISSRRRTLTRLSFVLA